MGVFAYPVKRGNSITHTWIWL